MIALTLKPATCSWNTLRFASSLDTRFILEKLVADVPVQWQPEVRLGLQEAIINAVRHGNRLDPSKFVIVEYANYAPIYQWLIRDQGDGFCSQTQVGRAQRGDFYETDECGRGTYILTQIFDYVEWNDQGNQVYLGKCICQHSPCGPLIS